MGDQFDLNTPNATWLLDKWMTALSNVLQSMTEDNPDVGWTPTEEAELGSGALIVEQHFQDFSEPMIWIGVPEPVHQELGRRVLACAGVESSDADENRATALEMVEQSISGLISSLNGRLSHAIGKQPSKQPQFFPSGLAVMHAVVTLGDLSLAPIWIAFNPLLISMMDAKPVAAAIPESVQYPQEELAEPPVTGRNFDLLLDVALPVSVSFGKTELAVKDVLKLTTGSIVELDRAVSEPVDIIVNNCTIARGEVVVVEGNYGVRILNLMSRKERLRTGGAAVAESRARVGAL